MSPAKPASKTISIVISCILFTLTVVSTTFALGVGARLRSYEVRLQKTEISEQSHDTGIAVITSMIIDVKESQKRMESLLLTHMSEKK
jgi:hypothetical protein